MLTYLVDTRHTSVYGNNFLFETWGVGTKSTIFKRRRSGTNLLCPLLSAFRFVVEQKGHALLVAANWSRPTGRSALVAADWSHGTTGRGQLVAKLENSFSEITPKIF